MQHLYSVTGNMVFEHIYIFKRLKCDLMPLFVGVSVKNIQKKNSAGCTINTLN